MRKSTCVTAAYRPQLRPLAEVLGLLRWLRLGLFNRERLEAVSEVLRVLRDVLEVLGKKRENVSISRQKMTRTKGGKGSDAARSFSTSSSRSDLLLPSEM